MPRRLHGCDAFLLGVLAVLGFAGNWYAVPVMGGVHLLLGGVATMLTALRRSLVETVVVAGVASLATVFLWGHPYAVITLTAEAATVGLLYQHRGGNAVGYDLVFWLLVGAPLIVLFYGPLGLDLASEPITLIALKQPVNGVAYTAIASAIQDTLRRRAPSTDAQDSALKLADVWTPIMVLFALLPALAGLTWHAQDKRRDTIRDASNRLESAVAWVAESRAPSGQRVGQLTKAHRALNYRNDGRYAIAAVDERAAYASSSQLVG